MLLKVDDFNMISSYSIANEGAVNATLTTVMPLLLTNANGTYSQIPAA